MSVYTKQNDQEAQEDVVEAAQVGLRHSPYRTVRQVTCRYDDGVLTLCGRVPTFHHKQLAQTAVAGIQSVSRVDNQIEVS